MQFNKTTINFKLLLYVSKKDKMLLTISHLYNIYKYADKLHTQYAVYTNYKISSHILIHNV